MDSEQAFDHSTSMSIIRSLGAVDLLSFSEVNLDFWTQTFTLPFYMQYLATWPELCIVSTHPGQPDTLTGYRQSYFYSLYTSRYLILPTVLAKTEGRGKEWHSHVTALTISPKFRKLGVARSFTQILENHSDSMKCYFIDLFVRPSNKMAVSMYRKWNYSVFRTVRAYYNSLEDAWDMRKPGAIDVKKETIRPNGESIFVNDVGIVSQRNTCHLLNFLPTRSFSDNIAIDMSSQILNSASSWTGSSEAVLTTL